MADEPNNTGWMSDVQRAIALMLIGTFAVLCVLSTFVVVWTLDKAGLADMAKTLQAALVNMALIALGFFFGNTMAKMAQDVGQQKVVDKLTSAPPAGPVAPVSSPPAATVVVAWWSKLEPPERAAIEAAESGDPRVAAFVIAAKSGTATPDDLAYLVTKELLKPERPAEIQKP